MRKNARLPREKIFLDPVHADIHVRHPLILELINTPEMQRLRRIKQLGVSHLTFHGAEHSRFGHSLGVYEITQQICDRFKRNYPSQEIGDGGWDDSNRLLALAAALLHDIGHGAFSHTFEQLFKTDHEALTQTIILNEDTTVHQALVQIGPTFPQEVAAVISHQHPNSQVVQMISSQLDADRMDYLLRDSYFTGTNYGRFDQTRILRVMMPAKTGLIYQYAGMHAIEDYLVSRYQMYLQVYFHPVTRGMETILKHLLKRARDYFKKQPTYFEKTAPLLLPFLDQQWSLKDYLALDDHVMVAYFNHWQHTSPDPILKDLAERFMNRKPFKSVTYPGLEAKTGLKQLKARLEALGYDTAYYLSESSNYDLPYDLYHPNDQAPRTQIELKRQDGQVVELSAASPLIRAIAGQEVGDERVYFPHELAEDQHVNLFDPLLKDIHQLTQYGILTPLNQPDKEVPYDHDDHS